MAKSKFITIEVNPVCHSSEVDDGDNLFLWAEIPNATPRGNGGTSILRSITAIDFDDNNADIELYFAQTKDADASVTGALGAASTIVNMTDAEVRTLKPLGQHMFPDVSHHESGDYANSRFYIINRPGGSTTINIPMFSFPTQAQIDAGNAVPGSIYVMGVATATKTYSVNGLKFYFTFEIA